MPGLREGLPISPPRSQPIPLGPTHPRTRPLGRPDGPAVTTRSAWAATATSAPGPCLEVASSRLLSKRLLIAYNPAPLLTSETGSPCTSVAPSLGSGTTLMDDGRRSDLQPSSVSNCPPARNNLPLPLTVAFMNTHYPVKKALPPPTQG